MQLALQSADSAVQPGHSLTWQSVKEGKSLKESDSRKPILSQKLPENASVSILGSAGSGLANLSIM